MKCSSHHAVGGLHQTGHRQLCHISNIGIIETTPATHCQHGGDPLQIQITFLDRQRASHAHHGRKLIIGQPKHVPDDARRHSIWQKLTSSWAAHGKTNLTPYALSKPRKTRQIMIAWLATAWNRTLVEFSKFNDDAYKYVFLICPFGMIFAAFFFAVHDYGR
ncbi:MAG: hypothetical protein WB041_30305, partial [Pseudolabrys sp.]